MIYIQGPLLDPVVDPVLDPVLDPVVRKLHDIYKARRGIISGGSFHFSASDVFIYYESYLCAEVSFCFVCHFLYFFCCLFIEADRFDYISCCHFATSFGRILSYITKNYNVA